jgi:hypothetical protein
MAGIWTHVDGTWQSQAPIPFADEQALHRLIADNPQFLPLAGSPRLAVLGSEVHLGSGYADILAVEFSGRPVIIEVKLAKNPQSRREIVAQAIAYAAFLRGTPADRLEREILGRQLRQKEHDSILDAVKAQDQEGSVDENEFSSALQGFLDSGDFRIVLALDELSAELERTVAYLDAVTVPALTIDLLTIEVYKVGGVQVALPQRVTPDTNTTPTNPARAKRQYGTLSDGAEAFKTSVAGIGGECRQEFENLIDWAEGLARLPNVRLFSYEGSERYTLLPRIRPEDSGLVTIWNDKGEPYLSFWRSVFERRAPGSIDAVEKVISPVRLGQGNTTREISRELLCAIERAYEEASGRQGA